MNDSNETFKEELFGRNKTTEDFIFVGFFAAITVLGLFLNLIVILVIKRKWKKRTANDCFILNLALSDLLFTLCIPADIYGLLVKRPYTQVFCKIFPPFSTVTYDLSVCTLTSMAIERHGVILQPLKPKVSKKSICIWLAAIWFVSWLCVLPYAIVNKSGEMYCEEDWPSLKYRQVYTVTLFVMQYFLPLMIIGGCYMKIGLYLAEQTKPGDSGEKASARARRTRSVFKKLRNRKQNLQATKVLAVLVLVFAIANLPGQIAWLLKDFAPKSYYPTAFLLMKIAQILSCIHSFSNALIYGALTKHFRREYIRIVCGSCLCYYKNQGHTLLRRTSTQKFTQKELRSLQLAQ